MFSVIAAERALRRMIDARSGGFGVGAAGAGVLFAVARTGSASAKEIASVIGASPAGTTGLLTRMEAAGLLRREPDPDDARAIRVTLTETGEAARAHALTVMDELNPRLGRGFTSDELDVVARWLDHVRALERDED